jgi:hypothetical protein
MRLGTSIGMGLLVVAGLGCSGGGGGQPGGSYNAISAGIEHPTGTLSATNADAVAAAYEASLSSGLDTAGGQRLESVASAETSVSEACPNGGTISVNANEASSTAVSETFSYNNCCESAGCCFNGGGNLYYASTGSSASSASGSFCENFQVTGTCTGEAVSENFSLCEDGTTGTLSYLVEVDGESFAVSGDYSDGNGTLTITGVNGTFTCTYTNSTGSCTGTSGSFTF